MPLSRREDSLAFGPERPYPLGTCLHDLFRERALVAPHTLAVVDGAISMTIGQMDEASDRLANWLLERGMGVDRIVGIHMDYCLEYVIACLGVLKAGGGFMPLEIDYPPAALERILESVAPKAVLTMGKWAASLPEKWRSGRTCLKLDGHWTEGIPAGRTLPDPAPGPDNLAFCVATSGTTGEPKIILCPHRGAVNSYWWRYEHLPYGQGEREACSIFFIWECLRPLLQGVPMHIIPSQAIYSPRDLVHFLNHHKITRVLFTPSLLEHILSYPGLDLAKALQHLRMVYLNGEVVTAKLSRRFRERLPHVRLVNDYSISECHDVCHKEFTPETQDRHGFMSVGPAMSNVNVYVLDQDGKPVPRGVTGEIYVGGAGVALGYLDRPELTAERFLPDPFVGNGSVMFRTGDKGRMHPDGELEPLGRLAFLIKLRGFSIVPGAVEAALLEHPEVDACVAAPINDPETGQARALAVYFISRSPREDGDLIPELRAHAERLLPNWSVPSRFIRLDALPINPDTGKFDHKLLPAQKTKSDTADPSRGQDLAAEVGAMFGDILGVPQAGPGDNFFHLGGSSLSAIALAGRLEERFGCGLHPIQIFKHPTPAGLARLLELKECTPVAGVVESIQPEGAKPPLVFIGSTIYLGPLSRVLRRADRPTFALNLMGLMDMDDAPPRQLVDALLGELTALMPQGPYHLGGFCLDSKLAVAMAHALGKGERGATLTLLDPIWVDDSFAAGIPRHLANAFRIGPGYLYNKVKEKLRYMRSTRQLRAPDASAPPGGEMELSARRFVSRVYDDLYFYTPPVCHCPASVFVTMEWRPWFLEPLAKSLAGPVAESWVRAQHDTMLGEAAVARYGRQLAARLDEMEQRPPDGQETES